MEFIEPTLTQMFQVVGLGLAMKLVVNIIIMKVIGLPLELPAVVREQELYYTNPTRIVRPVASLRDGILGILICRCLIL